LPNRSTGDQGGCACNRAGEDEAGTIGRIQHTQEQEEGLATINTKTIAKAPTIHVRSTAAAVTPIQRKG
jgi:hypothetical protein